MAKISSKGTAIQLEIATVYTTIAGVTEISGPSAEVGTMDVTDLASGVGREKDVTGHTDGGVVTYAGFFDPVAATLQAMTDLLAAPAVVDWKIIWPDAANTEWPFEGILTKCEPSAALDEPLRFSAETMLDGLVSYPT